MLLKLAEAANTASEEDSQTACHLGWDLKGESSLEKESNLYKDLEAERTGCT